MSSPGRPLEERLAMLGRRGGWSRRTLLGAGLLLAVAAPIALVPWQVSAQEREGDAAQLAEQWEDVLLLDALRYLRLAPWQLQELRLVARTTDGRLARLREEEAKTQTSLRRIARKQREALVMGRSVSLQEQSNALLLEKTLKTAREKAAAEILAFALGRVIRVLSPEQKARAILLTHGEMPVNTAKRPALLDPQSGFVMEEGLRHQARETATRRVLAQHYPAPVLDAISNPFSDSFLVISPKVVGTSSDVANGLTLRFTATRAEPQPLGTIIEKPVISSTLPEAQLAAARRDRERLGNWPTLANELVNTAAPKDLAEALGFHVRRLFTSPRLKTVIEERLRSGGQLLEDDPEPAPGEP